MMRSKNRQKSFRPPGSGRFSAAVNIQQPVIPQNKYKKLLINFTYWIFLLDITYMLWKCFLQNKQSVEIEDFNLKVKALCERKRGAATEMQGKTEIREFSFKSLLCERSFRQPELLRFSVPQYFIPLSSCRFMTNIQNCGTLTLSHVRIPTRRNKFLNNKQLKKKKSKKSLTANNDGRNQ